ncbi:MAG: hypothetical protein IVW54_14805 [Candidatus Binataceae bacterium]|nr:hypothetical protein [Candidatus Binataceae bacterium]
MQSTTQSVTRSMSSEFELANTSLVDRVEAMLERYCAHSKQHARLLNTLSMLEHIGSRKIMATQSGKGLDQPTLKHLAEETRHAFFFKRQAERAARHSLDYSEKSLAAPAAARMYFQRLDASTARTLGRNAIPKAAYLYMSMVVEFRAVWLYRLYQAVLERTRSAFSLRSVLAEEDRHLEEMSGALKTIGALDAALIERLCCGERRLFERLLAALERSVDGFALTVLG